MNGEGQYERPLEGVPAVPIAPDEAQAEFESPEHQAELEAMAPPPPPPRQPSVPVRLEWYGRTLGETNHAANYGPDGTLLQDHHVAIAPNTAKELGLNLGDWVWVGPQLRQYQDYSYRAPGVPNRDVVEVRDQKVDGNTTLRKATQQEIQEFAPQPAAMPTAVQASVFTGKAPSQITAADVNQFIQRQPERALIAGEPTTASYEQAAAEQEGGAGLGAGYGDDQTIQDSLESGGGLTDNVMTGNFPVPSTRGLNYTVDPHTGVITYENGMTADPRTKMVTWTDGHGYTFSKVGPYGSVTRHPTINPYRDAMGNVYDRNNNMRPIPLEGMIPKMTDGQAAALNADSLQPDANGVLTPDQKARREDLALGDLTQDQQNMVKAVAYYKSPVTAAMLRNPVMQFVISRALALNPNFNAANYDAAKRMLIDFAQAKQNTAGGQIRSLNQVVQHLSTLDEMSKQLNNTWNPKLNSVKQWLQTQAGQPWQKAYNEAAFQVANEMARAFRGSAPDQADIDRQLAALDSANSPAQLDMILHKTVPSLLGGALETLDGSYEAIMGHPLPEQQLIYAGTKQKLLGMGITHYGGRDLAPKGGAPAPAATATPAPGRYKPEDVITLKDGSQRRIKAVLPDGNIQLYPP